MKLFQFLNGHFININTPCSNVQMTWNLTVQLKNSGVTLFFRVISRPGVDHNRLVKHRILRHHIL